MDLDELPGQIKEEIKLSSSIRRINSIQNSPVGSYHKDNTINTRSGEEEEPKLKLSLPLSEVRALIKAWTSSEDSPKSSDVNMLTNYLQDLVESRQLVHLDICISCLHRCIEKRQSLVWQKVYHAIIFNVQTVMLAVYGLRLHVPKSFVSLHF